MGGVVGLGHQALAALTLLQFASAETSTSPTTQHHKDTERAQGPGDWDSLLGLFEILSKQTVRSLPVFMYISTLLQPKLYLYKTHINEPSFSSLVVLPTPTPAFLLFLNFS